MSHHELAGKHIPPELLPNLPDLMSRYYIEKPNIENPEELVRFGTSGHRGSSLSRKFTESHILAVVQAIVDYRRQAGITGPIFLGKDTHALSEAAFKTAVEVLAANRTETFVDERLGFTPTPVISHAILTYNRGRKTDLADGIVITPSHNPPEDGGLKYNPPHGGPADKDVTKEIADRANTFLKGNLNGVRRLSFSQAIKADSIRHHDYITAYVDDLINVIDLEAIRNAGLKIGADALGGAGLAYWPRIAERYGLNIEVMHAHYEPSFRFMPLDHDGKIRMDCSSRFAMAGLIHLRDKYDIAFGNDPDFDRHGIVTPTGLMNPNHYLAVAVSYLFQHRPAWSKIAAVGKTLVSSSIIDRVAQSLGRDLIEVPVGFKWFVDGLSSGRLGFGGEESAGASFLRKNGGTWTTDKDGFILALLAAEILAVTGKDPQQHYDEITGRFGATVYRRKDVDATLMQLETLKGLSPEVVTADTLAGEKITAKITRAPGNNEPIDGLKVTTENGWFAARPSGTEPKFKIYAESFKGKEHLEQLVAEAEQIVAAALAA